MCEENRVLFMLEYYREYRTLYHVDIANGKEHDFSLFKNSKLAINKDIQIKVDLGYQGIHKYHSNIEIQKKKSKNYKLTDEDKKENQKKLLNEFLLNILMLKLRVFKYLNKNIVIVVNTII